MNVYRYKTTYEGSTIPKDYTFDAVDEHAAVAHVCEKEGQDNLDSGLSVQELREYGETTIGDGNLDVVRR